MNLEELKLVINAMEHLIGEDTKVCINDSRDGITSLPEAKLFLIKNQHDEIVIAWEYE